MEISRYFIKKLTKAEANTSDNNVHEIYIRLTNDFNYEEFFQTSGSLSAQGTRQIDFKATDITFSNQKVVYDLKFVYYENSNREKRIPSMSQVFTNRGIKAGDIVCLESRTTNGHTSFYITFCKANSFPLSGDNMYYCVTRSEYCQIDLYKALSLEKREDVFTYFIESIDRKVGKDQVKKYSHTYIPHIDKYVKQIPGYNTLYEIDSLDIYKKVATIASKDMNPDPNYAGAYQSSYNKYGNLLEELMSSQCRIDLTKFGAVHPVKSVRYNFTTQYKQKIRYGAPGTGKSFSMQNESNVIRVTFHPDTDYSSFVGCYKPRTKDGKVIYDFVPQAFLQAYTKAWCDPQHEYMLIVEEINRGNCAQIFGDLFQLLDRDDEGYSRYPIVCDTDMWEIYLKSHLPVNYITDGLEAHYRNAEHAGESFTGEGKMALPPNLSICATMNTSDQSLYKMDSAFKRRWLPEYVPIRYKAERVDGNPIDGDTGLAKLEDVRLDFYQEKPWLEILYAINSFIRNRLNSTSKQMGQWFIVPEKDNKGFANIKFEIFRDKLMFYLFNDAFKKSDALNQPFGKEDDGFLFLFEDLCLEQDGGKELCKTFIDNIVNEFPYPNE